MKPSVQVLGCFCFLRFFKKHLHPIFPTNSPLDKALQTCLKWSSRLLKMKLAQNKYKIFSSLFLTSAILLSTSATVLAYGENADWTKAPSCGNPAPAKPWLYSAKAVTGGIDLNWTETRDASSWTVAYGVRSGVYPYGIDRFGNNGSRSVRLGSLPSGTYYVVLRANNGCMPGPFSDEKQVSVGGGGRAIVTANTPLIPAGDPSNKPSEQTTPKVTPQPTSSARRAVPTVTGATRPASPTPVVTKGSGQSTSFFQNIINFFRGLFK